jgi:hypothetical protein
MIASMTIPRAEITAYGFYRRVQATIIMLTLAGTCLAENQSMAHKSSEPAAKSVWVTNSDDCLEHPEFKVLVMGETKESGGARFATTIYSASDGVGLEVLHGEFDSALAAKHYLGKMMAKASHVVSSGGKKNKKGDVVGERAVVILGHRSPKEASPAILLTFGDHYYEIRSRSFCDSLALEMRLTSTN